MVHPLLSHTMLIEILTHTPAWVYAVFALLVFLGGRQLRAGSSHLARVVGMPLAMIGLAAHGVSTTLAASPAGYWSLAAWLAAALLAAAGLLRQPLPAAVRYDPDTRRLFQPGSWMPLALMMAIFLTKYAVGVALALRPGDARQAAFALGIGALYGLFSGVFAGRALRLWRLVQRTPRGGAGAVAA